MTRREWKSDWYWLFNTPKNAPTFPLGLRNPPKPTTITPERALAGYQRYMEKVGPLEGLWHGFSWMKAKTFEQFLAAQNYTLEEIPQ